MVASSYLTELRLDIDEKRRRLEAYDATLTEVRDYMRVGQVPPQITEQPVAGERGGSTIQFGETALSEIVQLAEQASFASFVQDTLQSRHRVMLEISNLTRELELVLNEGQAVIEDQFRTYAAEMLRELTRQYSELVTAAANQLRDRGGELYEPSLGPLITGASPLSMRNLLIVATAGVAGGLLAVIGVLFWSGIRPRRT